MSSQLFQVTAFALVETGSSVGRNLSLMNDTGTLRYDEERVVYNPTAKFGFEPSKISTRVVHLRCLHNNKYLVRNATTRSITATAAEPVEDATSPDSTLFRLETVGTGLRWVHLAPGYGSASEKVVGIMPSDHPTQSYQLSVADGITAITCTPIDVDRIIKLPDTVVFKGDNGKYMKYSVTGTDQLQFTGEDRNEKESWYKIVPISNGDVRVMCEKTRRYLKRQSNGLIRPDTSASPTDIDTFFQVARLNNNTIALMNRGNTTTSFCQRTDTNNDFRATTDSGVKTTGLLVEEPVVTRNIEVEFRLEDARIYDVQPRSWLSQVAHNKAGSGDFTTTLSIAYTEALSCTFTKTTSVSTEVSVSTTFTASIPFVADISTEIGFTAGQTVETSFGKTIDKTETMQFSTTVIIPAGEKRRARIMANEAKCDVPFSYVQTEVMADNTIVRTVLHDGIYKGMNGYEFHVQVYDPDSPEIPETDEPVATQMLPDVLGREKIYRKMKN